MPLLYSFGKLSFEEVWQFLIETNDEFPIPLSLHVDIDAYARKLSTFSDFSICRNQEEIVGMISCYTNNPPTGYISNVCVKREFQGKGVLSKLFRLLVVKGIEKGIHTVRLEVDENNAKALSVYNHLGFHLVETRKDRNKLLLECTISHLPFDS